MVLCQSHEFQEEISFSSWKGHQKSVLIQKVKAKEMKQRKEKYTISSGTMVIDTHLSLSVNVHWLSHQSVSWFDAASDLQLSRSSHTYSFWEQSSSLFSLSKQAHISHWRLSHSWHNEQIKTVWANWIMSEEQRTLQSNGLTMSSSQCSLPVSMMKLK